MKKHQILAIISMIIIIFLIFILFFIRMKNNVCIDATIADNTNIIQNSIDNKNLSNNSKLYEITDFNEIEKNVIKTEDEPIMTQDEINTYWENYTNPEHWSQNTKKYTLAYALKDDKYDNEKDYITNADSIIESHLNNKNKGIYITESLKIYFEDYIGKEISNLFYIDDGMLKYNKTEYNINNPIDELLIYAIDNSSELLVLDTGFAYIDEEQGDNPYSMPDEIEYLQFNIDNNKRLLIYNLRNLQFETFIGGIQTLTGKMIETE